MLSTSKRPFRTYKRRKPDYQVIEGVKDSCRLCLNKSQDMVSIFSSEPNHICSSLATRIMLCVGLEMTCEEQLPNMICTNCHSQLETCYKFRKMCETAYQKLKLHLQAVKMKEYHMNNLVQEEKTEIETIVNEIEEEVNVGSIDVEPHGEPTDVTNNIEYIDTVLVISNEDEDIIYDNESSQNHLVNIGDTGQSTTEINIETSQIQQTEVVNHNQLVVLKSHNTECFHQTPPPQQPHQSTDNGSADSQLASMIHRELMSMGVLRASGELSEGTGSLALELVTADGYGVVMHLEEEDDEDDKIKSIKQCKEKTGKKEDDKQCHICNKRFSRRGTLVRHMRTHAGERPHACSHCGRTFAQKEVMRRHELVHKEKRPFPCPQCPKSFTQRGALAAHARTHGARGLTLHPCPQCRKLFLHASGLCRHLKTHIGSVYHCGECGRTFADKSSLKRHIRTNKHTVTQTKLQDMNLLHLSL